nr:tannase/feruloyl esterase family alpha/beta hydrolase [Dactylosporangium thailandense]
MPEPIRTILVATAATVLSAVVGVTPATADAARRPATTPQGLAALPAVQPVIPCADVLGLKISNVTLQSATIVTANTPAPYCEVRGSITPNNTIVVRMPVNGWTQRYVQTGCGGLCGNANINYGQAAGCPVIADGTVASATTDMGHQGQNDGSWAAGNPQAQIDFAYRGVHETAVAAKALIKAFYKRGPVYSYFTGCSDGGREALMEAQRYPDDFDGIAAGAPASNMAVQNTFHHAWNVLANKDANGNSILLAGKLPLVHTAVLRACDRLDGLTDGLIDDPRLCRFNPDTLRCATGQAPTTCLSPAEATVVRKLHDGATDTQGNRLEPAIAHEWGSELEWTLFIPAAQGQPVASEMFALSYLRHLADPNHPSPGYQLTDLRFTVSAFWKTVLPSSTYMAALDPDLSRFQRSGGKLILWHGWNDQHISPQNTLVYWDTVNTTMGERTVDRFARLYLFPGMAHCGGGEGPNTFDVLTPVMAWVESGAQPGKIVASRSTDGTITRTRPIYPYPTVARYDGTGSVDDAASFVPYTPRDTVRNDANWVGQRLFSSDYQTWPRVVNGRLVL